MIWDEKSHEGSEQSRDRTTSMPKESINLKDFFSSLPHENIQEMDRNDSFDPVTKTFQTEVDTQSFGRPQENFSFSVEQMQRHSRAPSLESMRKFRQWQY